MNKFMTVLVTSAALHVAGAVPMINPETIKFAQDKSSRVVSITYDLEEECAIVTFDVLTNGVSIGAINFTNAVGDINRKINAGKNKRIVWRPWETWPGFRFENSEASIKVTAWSTNSPPLYMVVDLDNPAPENVRYYADADAVPNGVTDMAYKTSKLVMRRIPATGVMWRMGDIECEINVQSDNVSRLVVLTNDYYIGIYPVTQGQWRRVYDDYGASGKSRYPSVYSGEDRDVHPVENVEWSKIRGDGDSDQYNWPRDGHRVNSSYFLGCMRAVTSIQFDLPTEAQWEFACRAGTTGTNNVDGVSLDDTAWHSGIASTSMPVGLKLQNAFGLYDMLGNVEELCLDRKGGNKANADGTPVIEPVGADSTSGNRIRKGGGFIRNNDPSIYWCRPGITSTGWSQNAANKCMGFRLCCPIMAP